MFGIEEYCVFSIRIEDGFMVALASGSLSV